MSFRLKTILGISIIQALLLFILILNSLNMLRSSNEEELHKRAYTTAKLFATTTKEAVLSSDLASLENFVQEVLHNSDIVYARVRGKQGTVLAESGDAAALKRVFKADNRYEEINDNVFDADADITVGKSVYGRVEIGLSTDAINEVITASRRQTIAIAIAEMVAVALFSFFLGLYLTRGLAALKLASQRIAKGELWFKVEVKGNDELAQTAQSFNEMSDRLDAYDKERRHAQEELRRLNEELERRVKSRTEQLADAYSKIEHQALHDFLTKLPNRQLFHDRLEQAILTGQRENKLFALVMMDLNAFKAINDSLGHQTGDAVLQETAVRLRNALRQSDTVARLGGDEFALILPTVKDVASAVGTMRKVLEAINKPLTIAGRTLYIGGSLGVALYPADGKEASLLMQRADMAMYAAKQSKTGYKFYDPGLEQHSIEHIGMQFELQKAIDENQLVLYYQPKIDFASGRISGVEALVRWLHPTRGLIFPDDFIPLAERTELIKPLTVWVLNAALHQCKIWRDADLDLSVSINTSMVNIQDPEFPKIVRDALQRFDVDPNRLELEVAETWIMIEPSRAIEAITTLNDIGVQIIIDNFGTGYSSMAYLKKLPIARIKVDRSFVRNMTKNTDDAVIVRSIIGLGHNLGFNVVAEGVESEEIWNQLRDLNCDSAQGYCMSRPIPAEEFARWLQESPHGLAAKKINKLSDAG